jgi:hypothetical protein
LRPSWSEALEGRRRRPSVWLLRLLARLEHVQLEGEHAQDLAGALAAAPSRDMLGVERDDALGRDDGPELLDEACETTLCVSVRRTISYKESPAAPLFAMIDPFKLICRRA